MRSVNRALTRILASLMIAMILLCNFVVPNANPVVRADENINLYCQASVDRATAGDVVTITVYANHFPYITSIEDVKFSYNPTLVEFLSFQPSPTLNNFLYYTDSDSEPGIVNISMTDEMSINQIEEDITSGAYYNNNYVNPAHYSEEDVIVFSLSFRIMTTSVGTVPFGIIEVGAAIDADGIQRGLTFDSPVTVTTEIAISNDAYLAGLSAQGVSLTPDFNMNTTEYAATVGRDVSEIILEPVLSNIDATVTITGATGLSMGENLVTINVTAQDGHTTRQYRVYVTRQEDVVSESAGIVDMYGKSYSFLDLPQNIVLPEGFVQTSNTINGYNVQCYSRVGVASVIVYLYDGENAPGFYFYNATSRVVIPYNPDTTIIRPSRIYMFSEVPDYVTVPEGLTEGSYEIHGKTEYGYFDKSGNFVCYLKDENNECGFFLYIEAKDTFVEYNPVSRTKERAYSFLFKIFLTISLVQAVIIISTVLIIHSIVARRSRPRPRRV